MPHHILLVCKDVSDLHDMLPLREALSRRGHRPYLVVDRRGTIVATKCVPEDAVVADNAHEVRSVIAHRVDAVVSSCPEGDILTTRLADPISAPYLFLQDARRVRFPSMLLHERMRSRSMALLANDEAVHTPRAVTRFITGLPRYDRHVRMDPSDRKRRRGIVRHHADINEASFVVLFAGQESESASILMQLALALNCIPTVESDNPIKRVLAVLKCSRLNAEDARLWSHAISVQSSGQPSVRVLHNVEQIGADKKDYLGGMHIVDAVLAADVVVSSTSSVLYTAAALGVNALSYFAPGFGEDAYIREKPGAPTVQFPISPASCVRHVRTYNDLCDALQSAIPRRTPGKMELTRPRWMEQAVANNQASWLQGNNTDNCVVAIETFIAQCATRSA